MDEESDGPPAEAAGPFFSELLELPLRAISPLTSVPSGGRQLTRGSRAAHADAPGPEEAPAGAGPLQRTAEALRSGSESCTALVDGTLAGIARTEPDVHAWALVDEAGARSQAARLDDELQAGGARGWLHGIPVGVKDLVDVRGLPTRAGSRHNEGDLAGQAPEDAAVVRGLREAGAVILGKTHTHEFAFGGLTPPTRNPRDHERIPGGSSGGSAAAVAAGQVPLAVGTDSAGSVRIPSSYCGIVGFVPSPGLVAVDGVLPVAWSLDRVGYLTATARDMALAASALGLADPALHGTPALGGLRVGVPRQALASAMAPGVRREVQHALELVARSGAEVVEVDLPHAHLAVTTGLVIALGEFAEVHRERLRDAAELFGEDLRGALSLADTVPASAYVRAQRLRRVIADETVDALGAVDLLVTPTMPVTAPPVAEATAGDLTVDEATTTTLVEAHLRFTVTANLAGLPALTQPCGVDDRNLPVGLQWMAAAGADDRLLEAAASLELALEPAPDVTPNVLVPPSTDGPDLRRSQT